MNAAKCQGLQLLPFLSFLRLNQHGGDERAGSGAGEGGIKISVKINDISSIILTSYY